MIILQRLKGQTVALLYSYLIIYAKYVMKPFLFLDQNVVANDHFISNLLWSYFIFLLFLFLAVFLVLIVWRKRKVDILGMFILIPNNMWVANRKLFFSFFIFPWCFFPFQFMIYNSWFIISNWIKFRLIISQ